MKNKNSDSSPGMEASGRHIEVELADTDAEAPDTQVTQAQHPRPVCHHHRVHLSVKGKVMQISC